MTKCARDPRSRNLSQQQGEKANRCRVHTTPLSLYCLIYRYVGALQQERAVLAVAVAGKKMCADVRCQASPLQDIRLLRGFPKTFLQESTILYSFRPPSTCIVHPGAILLHDWWTVYNSPSDLLIVRYIHHTILVMPISCKGQCQARNV